MKSLQPDFTEDVLAISAISCFLSIVGGVIIFASFILIPEIRNYARKLVVCLTIADVISAVAYLVSVIRYTNTGDIEEEDVLCEIQSFVTTYSSIVSFCLTSIIAIYIFDTVINKTDRLGSTCWLVIFNLISWVFPGTIAVSALVNKVLGSDRTNTGGTGPWCWISTNTTNPVTWMVVAGKGWEIACYLITMSLYVLLKVYLFRHYRRAKLHHIHFSLRNEDTNFLYVWFLLYVLRFWGTLRFFLFATFNPSEEEWYMEVLLRLQAFGDPGQAFGNCFLFCVLDKTVRMKMKQYLLRCKRKQKSGVTIAVSSSQDVEYERVDDSQRLTDSAGYGSMSGSYQSFIPTRESNIDTC